MACDPRSDTAVHDSHATGVGLENLALRQQVAVWKVRQPRPQLTATVVLSRLWKNWRSSLQVVRPETVVRWHRQGFRRYWAWKSRHRGQGRPAIGTEVRDLIRRMSRANPLWGAPRIHGELLKLGLTVSQATVSKYMLRQRKPPSQVWRTFLKNHAQDLIALDFFTVPTATFRVLFVLVVLSHGRPKMRPSRGVRRRRARAGWWRYHAWVGSITNTAGVRLERIGRISGRHRLSTYARPAALLPLVGVQPHALQDARVLQGNRHA